LLEKTFIHIQGIGQKTEMGLWRRGIQCWDHFLNYHSTIFSPTRDKIIRQELASTIKNRERIAYFTQRLPTTETWRIYEAFKERAVYLDIETSGGYQGVDEITVIGLFNGKNVRTFINGINLEKFEMEIAKYDLVITFNGKCFDLPFIYRSFPNIVLPLAHIDLRFLLKRIGYRGGLKSIEKQLGISRTGSVMGLDGYDAVMLWKAYQWGDEPALERLIQYNTADIVNLKPLMELGYEKMKENLLSQFSSLDL
jgi:uncharacterized protein YprB with RNaseH-like and TPR domain